MNGLEELRARIVERHGSLHAFCKAHPELKRSSVYLVMSGRYPGRSEVQMARIDAALEGGEPRQTISAPALDAAEMAEALQEIRCNNCRLLDRRSCLECRTRTRREAGELYARIYPGRR